MLDGHTAAAILATKRRLNQIRTPLLEALDAETGLVSQEVAVRWVQLKEAFNALENAVNAATPIGAPYP